MGGLSQRAHEGSTGYAVCRLKALNEPSVQKVNSVSCKEETNKNNTERSQPFT